MAVAVAGVVVLAGIGGIYAYFFSGIRTAPMPLALATASPAVDATPTPSATAAAAGLAGMWSAAQGPRPGYRVKEVFAGQTSTHEAVARTSAVSGNLMVQPAAAGLEATTLTFTAQLAGLQLPATLECGQTVAMTVPGQLTIQTLEFQLVLARS